MRRRGFLIVALWLAAGLGAQTPEPLHLLVGKSVEINSAARFTRVLVSNPAVMQALATTPHQVVVEGKTAGGSSLLLWDETGRSRMMDVTVDVDVAGLRQAIADAYPAGEVGVEADGARIELSGMVRTQAAADNLVKIAGAYSANVVNSLRLDPPPPVKEVMLAVKIAEVDRSKADQFAVNLIGAAPNMPVTTSTQQLGPPTGVGGGPTTVGGGATTAFGINNLLNIFLYRPDLNFGAAIADLVTKNVLQILAEPNLMAMSGEKASFLAGGQFPVPVVQGGPNVGAVTIEFRPYGVELDFTATVNPDNTIQLHVAPEVSSLDYTNAVTISGFTVPALSTRKADTVVELKDGQSFGIAGLLDQTVTAQMSRMPGIANVPILGQLFRSHNNSQARTDLLVFVTPRIVDPLTAGTETTKPPAPAMPYLNAPGFDQGLPGGAAKPKPGGGGR